MEVRAVDCGDATVRTRTALLGLLGANYTVGPAERQPLPPAAGGKLALKNHLLKATEVPRSCWLPAAVEMRWDLCISTTGDGLLMRPVGHAHDPA